MNCGPLSVLIAQEFPSHVKMVARNGTVCHCKLSKGNFQPTEVVNKCLGKCAVINPSFKWTGNIHCHLLKRSSQKLCRLHQACRTFGYFVTTSRLCLTTKLFQLGLACVVTNKVPWSIILRKLRPGALGVPATLSSVKEIQLQIQIF